jgi:glycerol uptake facilitator-like aquaporin
MAIFSLLSSLFQKVYDFTPPGLVTCLAAGYIGSGRYFSAYRHEFVGTLLMIGLTFSPGKWIGQNSLMVAWIAHACGVIAADKIGGGPHVNPAVTVSMYALGKCSYTESFVRIMGAMAGGLVAFPLFSIFADQLGLTQLGGPEFNSKGDEEGLAAGISEFWAVTLLMIMIYTLNWELNFGKYHYWIKQTLTAVGIRYLIETFPRAGPAINPMLGTTWYIFANGAFPNEMGHYFTYWVCPFAAALFSSYLYVVYAGGTVFGQKVPLGPVKGDPAASSSKKNK